MKAIGYCRVSTEDQAAFGVSLSAQEQRIKQYAALYDIEIVEVIQDAGISAKNLNRPGMQRILSMMEKKEIDSVIVAKLDRLTRSIRDLSELMELSNKKGVALISVSEHIDTGSAAGRMMVNMLGTISQWERETIGERTAMALRFKRDSGQQYNGEPLFGFIHEDGRLIPCENEQKIADEICLMHKNGLSFGRIARMLNATDRSTRSGGKWYPEQVRRVVVNAKTREKITETNFETVAA